VSDVVVSIVQAVVAASTIIMLIRIFRQSGPRPGDAGYAGSGSREPMTAAHLAMIERSIRPTMLIFGGIAVLFFVAANGYAYFFALSNPGMTLASLSLAIIGSVVAVAAALYGVRGVRNRKAELAEGIFIRTHGPISLTVHQDSRKLHLSDRDLYVSPDAAKALEGVQSATVDHSPRTGILFEARDEDGTVLFRDPRLAS
jgi:hypothetical protein